MQANKTLPAGGSHVGSVVGTHVSPSPPARDGHVIKVEADGVIPVYIKGEVNVHLHRLESQPKASPVWRITEQEGARAYNSPPHLPPRTPGH